MNRLVEWARESKVTEEEGVEETLRVGEEEEGDGTGDEGTAKPRDDPPLPTTMERLILTADEDDEGTSQTPLIPPKSPARSLFELKSPFDFDALWTRGSEGRGSDGTGERGKQQTGTDWGGSDNILRPSLRNAGLSLTQQPLSSRRQVQPLTFPSLRNPTSPTQRPAPSPEATPRNLPPPAARPSMTEQNSSGRYPPEYIQFLIEEHAARKAGGGGRRRGGGVGIMVG